MHKLLLLSFAFVLSACGGKFSRLNNPNYTSVRFAPSSGKNLQAQTAPGGIIVYAMRVSDQLRFGFKLGSALDTRDFIIPNGKYKFLGVGYGGTNLTGTMHCGFGSKIAGSTVQDEFDLLGGGQTINLTLDSTNCSAAPFNDTNYLIASAPIAPNLIFCSATTDISGFTPGSDCQAGKESSHFLAMPAGSGGVEMIDISGGPEPRVVYTANHYGSTRYDLFSVRFDGTGFTRQSTALVASGNVDDVLVVPGNRAVYIADQDTAGITELYITNLGSQNSTKISKTVSGGGTGVKEYALSPNGRYIVYVGSMDAAGKEEIYTIDLQGPTPLAANNIKLNSGAPTGAGVTVYSGSTHYKFEISPDSSKVLYAGEFDSTGDDIYLANIAGAASGQKPYTNGATVNGDVFNMGFTSTGNYIVWIGAHTVTNPVKVFKHQIGAAVDADDPDDIASAIRGTSGAMGLMAFSHAGDKVAFAMDYSGSNSFYSIHTLDAASGTFTRLRNAVITNAQFKRIEFTPNDTTVVWVSDEAAASVFDIYSGNVSSALAGLKLNGALAGTGLEICASSCGGVREAFILLNDSKVLYRGYDSADGGGTDIDLMHSTIGTATTHTVINTGTTDVTGYSQDQNGRIYFIDNPAGGHTNSEGFYIPFDRTTSTFGTISSLDTFVALENLDDVTGGPDDETPNFPAGFLAFGGAALGGSLTKKDLFLRPNFSDMTAAGTKKVTRHWNGANGMGSYKVHLLAYASGPGGEVTNIVDTISSACVQAPGTNGGNSNPGIKLPAGMLGANNPFAVAVDVFPDDNAVSCTGHSIRYMLPNGLAHTGSSPQAPKLKSIADGAVSHLIVKD